MVHKSIDCVRIFDVWSFNVFGKIVGNLRERHEFDLFCQQELNFIEANEIFEVKNRRVLNELLVELLHHVLESRQYDGRRVFLIQYPALVDQLHDGQQRRKREHKRIVRCIEQFLKQRHDCHILSRGGNINLVPDDAILHFYLHLLVELQLIVGLYII